MKLIIEELPETKMCTPLLVGTPFWTRKADKLTLLQYISGEFKAIAYWNGVHIVELSKPL